MTNATKSDEYRQMVLAMDLDALIIRMKEISGEWDGDNPGELENKSHIAEDIIKSADKLRIHLEEMVEYIDVGNA